MPIRVIMHLCWNGQLIGLQEHGLKHGGLNSLFKHDLSKSAERIHEQNSALNEIYSMIQAYRVLFAHIIIPDLAVTGRNTI